MNIKEFVKNNVTINKNDNSINTLLEIEHEGEWNLARKAEYKNVIYKIPGENIFLQVKYGRTGNYHNGYENIKPTFDFVSKVVTEKTVFEEITDLEEVSAKFKETYFDEYDETKLSPIYQSGWKKADKANYFDSVYNISGVLLKQTLIGDSDYTALVEYSIVEKKNIQKISFEKIEV